MNELLKKDIIIKVGSVLLGILLWLYVLNIDNPYEPRRITVPIKVVNRNALDDKDIYLKNEAEIPSSIEVTIRGRKEEVDIISQSDFMVTLDYSKIESVEDKTLRVDGPYLVNPRDVVIVSSTPQIIKVDLEAVETKVFPVDVEITGSPKEGYRIIKTVKSPETVSIKDLQSKISLVDSIRAAVNVSGLDRHLEKKLTCKAYDKQGKEIPSIGAGLSVDIVLEVAKEVPVTLVVRGKPAKDHVEVSRTIAPNKVLITGSSETIAGIGELKTKPVDIDNISQSASMTGIIELPEGVRLVDSPDEVTVSFGIEPLITRELTVDRQNVVIENTESSDGFEYEIVTESIPLVLKGRQSEIQNLNAENLKPSIDVKGLTEGTHKVKLKAAVSSTVTLVSAGDAEVKISKIKEQQ